MRALGRDFPPHPNPGERKSVCMHVCVGVGYRLTIETNSQRDGFMASDGCSIASSFKEGSRPADLLTLGRR